MKAIVIQLSVCPCGFPCCVDSVAIGTEYEAMGHLDGFRYICGGCGEEQMLTGLYVKRCGGFAPSRLPAKSPL